jgi:hypothetical protein
MNKKTTGMVAIALVVTGLVFGPVRRYIGGNCATIEREYRGLILELPKAQLAWVKKGDWVDVICALDSVRYESKTEIVTETGGAKKKKIPKSKNPKSTGLP